MRIAQPRVEVLAYTQLPPTKTFSTGQEGQDTMKLVPNDPCSELSRVVERCGRISWKSEDKLGLGTADGFMTRVVNIRKDESIAEHCSVTILFVTDRYTTHQLVRHRIAAYTQESTHYINYGKKGDEIEVMAPMGISCDTLAFNSWYEACLAAELAYMNMVKPVAEGGLGVHHKHARFALPGCLKTEIAVTFNLRIWRYVLGLRTTAANTPEIVHVMKLAGNELAKLCPEMFADYALKEAIGAQE